MTGTMERRELLAWLGDHELTDRQVDELVAIANEINARYPDSVSQRDAALRTACRLVSDPEDGYVLGNLADELVEARLAEAAALAAIEQAARQLVPTGHRSENYFARATGVDRMTVRKWLGKRG